MLPLLLGVATATAPFSVRNLRTEYLENPLGLDKAHPRFTWELVPSSEITVGSQLKNEAEKAQEYLTRVTSDHAGTPWSTLADTELKEPMGWTWKESFTPTDPPRNRVAANNNNQPAPADEERQMLKRPPPKRKLPKL